MIESESLKLQVCTISYLVHLIHFIKSVKELSVVTFGSVKSL